MIGADAVTFWLQLSQGKNHDGTCSKILNFHRGLNCVSAAWRDEYVFAAPLRPPLGLFVEELSKEYFQCWPRSRTATNAMLVLSHSASVLMHQHPLIGQLLAALFRPLVTDAAERTWASILTQATITVAIGVPGIGCALILNKDIRRPVNSLPQWALPRQALPNGLHENSKELSARS